ncbi:hypothetical protein FB45DRAFT_872272 [Roridomyces roridus]|uniref:Uncharacterized protein n=1 Tax=Roridomyces roridus TaxID=1738132 RepID=A0AAD7BDS2_9AGAR|nr:hypothetical protein FB45DRAFT_872272 [Roridomyces roridus]
MSSNMTMLTEEFPFGHKLDVAINSDQRVELTRRPDILPTLPVAAHAISVLPATAQSLEPAKPWSGLAGPSQAQAGCAAGFGLRLEISQAKKSPKPPAKPEPGPSRPGYPAQAPAWEFQKPEPAQAKPKPAASSQAGAGKTLHAIHTGRAESTMDVPAAQSPSRPPHSAAAPLMQPRLARPYTILHDASLTAWVVGNVARRRRPLHNVHEGEATTSIGKRWMGYWIWVVPMHAWQLHRRTGEKLSSSGNGVLRGKRNAQGAQKHATPRSMAVVKGWMSGARSGKVRRHLEAKGWGVVAERWWWSRQKGFFLRAKSNALLEKVQTAYFGSSSVAGLFYGSSQTQICKIFPGCNGKYGWIDRFVATFVAFTWQDSNSEASGPQFSAPQIRLLDSLREYTCAFKNFLGWREKYIGTRSSQNEQGEGSERWKTTVSSINRSNATAGSPSHDLFSPTVESARGTARACQKDIHGHTEKNEHKYRKPVWTPKRTTNNGRRKGRHVTDGGQEYAHKHTTVVSANELTGDLRKAMRARAKGKLLGSRRKRIHSLSVGNGQSKDPYSNCRSCSAEQRRRRVATAKYLQCNSRGFEVRRRKAGPATWERTISRRRQDHSVEQERGRGRRRGQRASGVVEGEHPILIAANTLPIWIRSSPAVSERTDQAHGGRSRRDGVATMSGLQPPAGSRAD